MKAQINFDPEMSKPQVDGLYEITYRFPGRQEIHQGTATWKEKRFFAADSPGGVEVLTFTAPPISERVE